MPTQWKSAASTTTISASSCSSPKSRTSARLDAVLRELAEELERDVRDDLDVHPGVVVDLHPGDRVDVRDVPPALELVVGVDALDQRAELAVAADRDVDLHPRDRLGGRQAGLVLGLGVDRLLDPLGGLLVESSRPSLCAV